MKFVLCSTTIGSFIKTSAFEIVEIYLHCSYLTRKKKLIGTLRDVYTRSRRMNRSTHLPWKNATSPFLIRPVKSSQIVSEHVQKRRSCVVIQNAVTPEFLITASKDPLYVRMEKYSFSTWPLMAINSNAYVYCPIKAQKCASRHSCNLN